MNTATMIGSLVFATVLALLIGVLIQRMTRGWRHRVQRQAALIGVLPALPATVSAPNVESIRGLYVGSTLAPEWNDRVVAGDLGHQAKTVLTRYPEGIMLQRSGAPSIWIPRDAILAVRTERGLAGRVVPGRSHPGVLAIRWRLPSGTEIDTGFRADDRTAYTRLLEGEQ